MFLNILTFVKNLEIGEIQMSVQIQKSRFLHHIFTKL
jgi:hypothetical protein